ncbi:hypothetical protein Si023_01799 [Streptococcus infantarius subsp. infantarius]|uniref:Panacea domain-containing protein n=1 Tax=uncultured Streptococcus sp. TaxID=83427 RepID=UPI000733AAF4|nr:type II toxin-antitoxin system antitoxin SocA domain-containing protein [uncultured Streptococcus sp.]ALT82430.1 hypothetical protein AU079_03525 [Streptococcus infantarius]MCO4640365.1 hypothetical protein [Streptococcus infantarius subsp. infantarius]MCO4666092.1 hypothetical protein [Streptococcus infantarius subsp. infantarius]
MFQHFILVASSYAEGVRVGYHLVYEGKIPENVIEEKMKKISDIKRTDIGVHSFVTTSEEWESVVELDSFFGDVVICPDFDGFMEVLESDLEIKAVDVAKFFLAMKSFSHLQVQKLVYLAYEKYLLKYDEKLFKERIVAYKYGPVVEEVYCIFKKYGSKTIEIDDETEYILEDIHLPQALGRMLLLKDAEKVVPILLDVIKEYGNLSASELVKLTHSDGGPWYTVYEPNMNCEITDDVIKEKAAFEIM